MTTEQKTAHVSATFRNPAVPQVTLEVEVDLPVGADGHVDRATRDRVVRELLTQAGHDVTVLEEVPWF